MLPPIIYRGSVKDVRGPCERDSLIFAFSDRYSVFDWGEMPDTIPDKGKALAATSYGLFRFLSFQGIAHHCQGLLDAEGRQLERVVPTRNLKVRSVKVIKPQRLQNQWNYSFYQNRPVDCLVPLEVIFRFGIPKGSSLVRRVRENPAYAEELQISPKIEEGAIFASPLIEFSTKLEEKDRFLSKQGAAQIAGLNSDELTSLSDHAARIAHLLRNFFAIHDIELWDGKLEFAFTPGSGKNREFLLVDAIGPDELRLVYKEIPLSKELIRQIYLPTPWYQGIKQAQELAKSRGSTEWRKLCAEELCILPEALSDKQLRIASAIYQNIADICLQGCGEEPWFPGKMGLNEVCALTQYQRS
jgi:phosphoribosylaminoimidazole-succinocarboxamide synthase